MTIPHGAVMIVDEATFKNLMQLHLPKDIDAGAVSFKGIHIDGIDFFWYRGGFPQLMSDMAELRGIRQDRLDAAIEAERKKNEEIRDAANA
jgi:hypothetical protein